MERMSSVCRANERMTSEWMSVELKIGRISKFICFISVLGEHGELMRRECLANAANEELMRSAWGAHGERMSSEVSACLAHAQRMPSEVGAFQASAPAF